MIKIVSGFVWLRLPTISVFPWFLCPFLLCLLVIWSVFDFNFDCFSAVLARERLFIVAWSVIRSENYICFGVRYTVCVGLPFAVVVGRRAVRERIWRSWSAVGLRSQGRTLYWRSVPTCYLLHSCSAVF